MRSFLRIVLFTAVGPWIGLLAIALLIGGYTLATTGSTRDFVFGPELFSPGILIVAYTVGGVPALLTGIAATVLARWLADWRHWLAIAAIGGLISAAGTFMLFGGGPEMVGARDQAPLILLVTLAGIVSALACAALFDGLAALFARKPAG